MNIFDILNSKLLYVLVAIGLLVIFLICILFFVRAKKRAKELDIPDEKVKATIKSSLVFSIVPSIAVIIGLITLTPLLGIPWPWFRLSVVGSLPYELTAAELAVKGLGYPDLASYQGSTDISAIGTIMFTMSISILGGMLFNIFFLEPKKNYETVDRLIKEAMDFEKKPDIIVLPEDWASGFSDKMFHNIENYVEYEDGPSLNFLRNKAKEYNVWIVAGSISVKVNGNNYNTTYVINRNGELAGNYSKMHLYSDMDEDVAYKHGEKTDLIETEFGKLGLMICYDIRFCELAKTYGLKGAEAIFVVSDFPNPRVDHWKTLLRARAIENQLFVVACNRVGESPMGTYCGHSLIVDPWGKVLVEGTDQQEIVYGEIDLKEIQEPRELIHVFNHRRPNSYKTIVKTEGVLGKNENNKE